MTAAGSLDPCWVAVCVPAHGDPADLARTIDAVRAQRTMARVHLVVAVDGPDPALEAVAAAADDVVVLATNQGSYAARNHAVDRVPPGCAAVLFTDADARPEPGWVDAHLAALAHAPRSGGAVRFVFSSPPRPAEAVDASRHLDQRRYVQELGYAATANLAVRPEVLAVVRFDATLRSGGDLDFGRRAGAAGFAIAWTPDAVVAHPARPTAGALLRKLDRVGAGARDLEAHGHGPATARRAARRTPAAVAAETAPAFRANLRWRLEARAIDLACSVVYARRVPSIIGPAIRRRLVGARP